jgi:hypothetical protein
MEYMFIGQNRVASDTIEESLQHSLALGDHSGVFLRLRLFHRIFAQRLLGRDGRDDKCWVQFHETQPQRLKVRVPVPGFCILHD